MEIRFPPAPIDASRFDKALHQDAGRTTQGTFGADADEDPEATPASLQQKIVSLADDMASVAAQFQRRREAGRKGDDTPENFDSVLQDDVRPQADQLIKIAGDPTIRIDALLQHARAMFADESDLWIVLRELLRRRNLSKVVRARLEALRQDVEREANAKHLKGGMHCALKAKLFGRKLGLDPRRLRDTYRSFLDGHQSMVSSYESWVGTYGAVHRDKVMRFVEASLAIDIHSADPSCSRLEFGALLHTVWRLRLLHAADHDFVRTLLQRSRLHPFQREPAQSAVSRGVRQGKPDDAEEDAWILLLCSLLRGAAPLEDVLADSVGDAMRGLTPEARSVMLMALRAAYRDLPDELFEGAREADQVYAALDAMMDDNYRRELSAQCKRPLRSVVDGES